MRRKSIAPPVLAKKVLAICLSAAIVCTYTKTLDIYGETNIDAHNIENNRVSVIVELENDALMASDEAAEMGAADYINTSEAKIEEEKIVNEQHQVQTTIEKMCYEPEFGYSYTDIVNGFSVEVNEQDVYEIQNIPGVKAVHRIRRYKPIDEKIEASQIADGSMNVPVENCCEMMGIDSMQDNGYTGEGMVVAVIDTELDVNHEMFSKQPKNPKFTRTGIDDYISGINLNANVKINESYKSSKIPFVYNYSDNNADVSVRSGSVGHGTHIAGTIVGNSGKTPDEKEFAGVAPDAQLIFMCTPDLGLDEIIAAMDDSVKFGVDVINCSFGENYIIDEGELFETAFNNAENAGIFVSAAAGNLYKGYSGGMIFAENVSYGSIGTPASYGSVTAVGSVDNTYAWVCGNAFIIEGMPILYGDQTPSFTENIKAGEYEYVYCGFGSAEELQMCDVEGKIALVDRGKVTFQEMAYNVANSGAIALIIANNEEVANDQLECGDFLPVALVSESSGFILKAVDNNVITVVDEPINDKVMQGNGGMSSMSSWSTMSTLELKPDISAVGGQIYSAMPGNTYGVQDGTSMAAAHLSGAAILAKQYIKDKMYDFNRVSNQEISTNDSILVQNILMSSADVKYQNADEVVYSPRVQGAGLVNLNRVTQIPVILTGENGKTKVSLGDNIGDTFTVEFLATNFTDKAVDYDSIDLEVTTDDLFQLYGFNIVTGTRNIKFDFNAQEKIHIPAYTTKKVSAQITLDSEEVKENMQAFVNGFFVDGYVFLKNTNNSNINVNIPFTGFYGDWTAAPALDNPYVSGMGYLGQTYLGSGIMSDCESAMSSSGVLVDNCVKIGKNIFSQEESIMEVKDERLAGISPNCDGLLDYLCINVTPLREAGKTTFEIIDKYGNVRLSKSLDHMSKYLPNCVDFSNNEVTTIPNGDYTAVVKTSFDYPGAKTESISMKFYVDTEPPQFTEAYCYKEEGKKKLVIKARDNKYVMAVQLMGTNNDGTPFMAVESAEPYDGITVVDVTNVNLDSLIATVYDYAMNPQSIMIRYIVRELPTSAVETTSPQETETVTPEITTTSTEATTSEKITTTSTEATTSEKITTTSTEATTSEKITTTSSKTTTSEKVTTTKNKPTTKVKQTTKVKETTAKNKKPAKIKITTSKNVKKKKIKLGWKCIKDVSGYQFKYSKSKSKLDKAKVHSTKSNSCVITKLTKNKTYYVVVRAYRKEKNKVYYGAWSKVAKVKIKK